MKKFFILSTIIFLILVNVVYAQITIDKCPDKCENSTLYKYGYYNEKTGTCEYKEVVRCEYGCRDTELTLSKEPECKELPPDTYEAQEEIYRMIKEIYNELNNKILDVKNKVDVINNLSSKINYIIELPKIDVFGTEYQVGDNGTVFIKLYQNKTPINNASCLLDIYYPDKTFFRCSTPMYYLDDGIYYYDFIIPNETGIYILSVSCNWITQVGDEENADNYSIINGTLLGGTLTDTYTSDNTRQDFKEVNDKLLVYYNFTNFTVNETIFELDIHLEYQWKYKSGAWHPSVENLYLEIYNYSNSSWYRIPQPITGSTSDIMWDYAIVNGVNGNFSDFVVNNGTIMIRFIDNTTDGNDDNLEIDHLKIIEKFKVDEILDNIRGGGELHVTNYVYEIKGKMDLINQTIMNKLYSIQDDLSEIYNLTYDINETVHNLTILDEIYNLTYNINETIHNLSVNLTNITNLIEDVNSTIMNKLFILQDELENVSNKLIELYNLTSKHNETVMNKLYSLQNDISDLGTLINNVNVTIMNKLYLIQDEIASVNDTVNLTNQSIMNKLYLIQDDLQDIYDLLFNVSNITINITGDLSLVAEDVWEMFLARGTPPLAPSTEYYCKDNNTLVKNITYEFCEGTKCKVYQKLEEIPCRFGCVENLTEHGAGCLPTKRSRTIQFMILLGVTTIVIGIIYYIFRTPY